MLSIYWINTRLLDNPLKQVKSYSLSMGNSGGKEKGTLPLGKEKRKREEKERKRREGGKRGRYPLFFAVPANSTSKCTSEGLVDDLIGCSVAAPGEALPIRRSRLFLDPGRTRVKH